MKWNENQPAAQHARPSWPLPAEREEIGEQRGKRGNHNKHLGNHNSSQADIMINAGFIMITSEMGKLSSPPKLQKGWRGHE